MNRVRSTRLKVASVAAVLTALTVACSDQGQPMVLQWDLTGQPTAERIGWTPSSDYGATVLRPIESVHFTFEDRIFEASRDIHDVSPINDGEWLSELHVDHQPMTVKDAAELMRSLGMRVTDAQIDSWVRRTEGTQGQETAKFRADIDQTGFGSAAAWVLTRYSFSDGRPVIVSVGFGWVRSLCEAALNDFGKARAEDGGWCP